MESSELALYRGLGAVRNYGVLVLIALFALNVGVLFTLNWVEQNELRNDLIMYSQTLPDPALATTEQTISLPADIISFRFQPNDRSGFYETQSGGTQFLAYANPEKQYTLMKSSEPMKHEVRTFALVLLALYFGEIIILLGWWFFLRSKIRELFETI